VQKLTFYTLVCGMSLTVGPAMTGCGYEDTSGPESTGDDAGQEGEPADDGGQAGAEADAGNRPDAARVAAADVCDRLSSIQCSGEASCCDAPGRDHAACKTAMRKVCEDELNLDEIAADSISGYNEYKAAAAFAAFESLVDDCVLDVVDWAISVDGFLGVVEGTREQGDDCAPPDLAAATVADVGAALVSCRNGASVACLPTASGWTCQPRGEVGGQCFTDANCKDGLYCVKDLFGYDGVCAERKPEDAPCTAKNECQSYVCNQGVCAPVDRQAAYCLL